MHNAAFAALGLNWRYLAFEVNPKNLRAAIEGAKAMNFAGLNLTVPHKLLALEMMDQLDESAKIWGAVNTIKFEKNKDGKVFSRGFNTDADGFIRAIKEEFTWTEDGLRGASALILGAGGAASTAALRLVQEEIDSIYLANRTADNARQLANKIIVKFPDYKIVETSDKKAVVESSHGKKVHIVNNYSFGPAEIVINATSLGLKPDDQLPEEFLNWLKTKHPKRVYDMIYRPAETKLLAAAKNAGCKTANGLGMLLYQGAKAFEIWTGKPAPLDVMRRALEENIYGH